MSTKTDHYTARIEVKEVQRVETDGGYNKPKIVDRVVVEVTALTVRADTLEKLRAKVAAHVALIED